MRTFFPRIGYNATFDALHTQKTLIQKIIGEVLRLVSIPRIFMWQYLRYFSYRMVFICKEHYGEKKYAIETWERHGYHDTLSTYKDAHPYYCTPYYVIERMIDYLKPGRDDVFVDFGCGKGRVVLMMSMQKIRKSIGIELHPELFAAAQKNLRSFKFSQAPVEFINADVVLCDLSEGTVFYFFNSFNKATLRTALNCIRASLNINPRKVRFMCFMCVMLAEVFDEQDWLAFKGEIGLTDVLVWESK